MINSSVTDYHRSLQMKQQPISPEGLRVDGRRAGELRAMSAELGLFKDADGSACVKQGNTTILASVYGPREVLF